MSGPGSIAGTKHAASTALVVLAALALVVPFAGKAVHVDDPLFVWMARHIVSDPLDPYGFSVNWNGSTQPAYVVNQNPPFLAYWFAAVGGALGWGEFTLHAAAALFTALAAAGIYALARALSAAPRLAALLAVVSPGFVVSSTTLMTDVPMLALYVWSLVAWIRGIQSGRHALLFASAVLIGAAALTKYFGITAAPLALVYALCSRVRPRGWWAHLAIPLAMTGSYVAWGFAAYDVNVIALAAESATSPQWRHSVHPPGYLSIGLAFTGAVTAPVALIAPWLWRPRAAAWGAVAALLAAGALASPPIYSLLFGKQFIGTPFYRVQVAVWMLAGIHALAVAVVECARRRDAAAALLACWIAGTLVFTLYVNHMINVRTLLPMLPAVTMLAADRFARMHPECGPAWRLAPVPMAAAAALALWVAIADAQFANASREAARTIAQHRESLPEHLYYTHHWGFQYYMDQLGASAFEDDPDAVMAYALRPIRRGDGLAMPHLNSMPEQLDPDINPVLLYHETPLTAYMSTMSHGAGFYSHVWGLIPFRIGRPPVENVAVYRFAGV